MPTDSTDPGWPRLLSLTVHEFRTPMTVVAGYVRMLLQERAGALNDQQRKLLQETEKSCGRLSGLLAELSDLANLEAGKVGFAKTRVDVRDLLTAAVAGLPPLTDREVRLTVDTGDAPALLDGDATRLRTALASVVSALRRELVTSDELHARLRIVPTSAGPAAWIAIADADRLPAVSDPAGAFVTFDEWRGGCGLSLPLARRVIDGHGGRLHSPADDIRAGAAIQLPLIAAP